MSIEIPAFSGTQLFDYTTNHIERSIFMVVYLKTTNLSWQIHNTSAYLSVLSEVMVQQLGVRLLVRWQDVKEGSWGITWCTPGVQGSGPPQCWRQVEWRWCPCVEALLVKRLRRNRRWRLDRKKEINLIKSMHERLQLLIFVCVFYWLYYRIL